MSSPHSLDPDAHATLFRSRASEPIDRKNAPMEEIAAGRLSAMIRMALSDPDEDYWPYRIVTEGQTIDGEHIRKLASIVQSLRP